MNSTPFVKFHGFGNDYIVIEDADVSDRDLQELAIAICHRHTGAGSDGIAVLKPSDTAEADFECEIVNPDGTIAAFSGNGTRCCVAYLYHKGIWTEPVLRLTTRSGIKSYRFLKASGDREYWFEAEIGKPRFASGEVPVLIGPERHHVLNEPILIAGRSHEFSAVNVGNPVACIFVDNFGLDWRTIGGLMETHEKFPERVNAVFVKVIDSANIKLRIWERGAGETAASGTCASGAAVLCALLQKTVRDVMAHSEGGSTRVVWRDDDEIVITGRADLAYSGEWPLG